MELLLPEVSLDRWDIVNVAYIDLAKLTISGGLMVGTR
jgi:hypothetical protein